MGIRNEIGCFTRQSLLPRHANMPDFGKSGLLILSTF
jgi:hypothetical protein